MADRLVVALLAAGRSSRFGAADKLAAPLAGKPLLQWAADAGLAVKAAEHLLVAPEDRDASSCPSGYALLRNPGAGEGMAASLRLAARHAREMNATALLVLLGDMPLVRGDHLAALLDAFARDRARPVFSCAPGGAPQPPAILPAALFPAVEALSGDSGARMFARDAVIVEASPDSLIDVDTPADLARCERLFGG